MTERSAWRANDLVAYDAMRESANTVIALLLRRAAQGDSAQSAALTEARDVRELVLAVDGYDRGAVDAPSTQARISRLDDTIGTAQPDA